jgi:hypothetical protein
MPGFLFFTYLAILLIPALQMESTIGVTELVGIFGGIIIASPVIGYVIYSPFNCLYEYISDNPKRGALCFVKNAIFDLEKDGFNVDEFSEKTKAFVKQKELIDIILHLDNSTKGDEDSVRVNNEVLNTLQSQLNNFSARVVMGAFTPIALLIVAVALIFIKGSSSFDFYNYTFVFSVIGVATVSIILLLDAKRVLHEAYVLEDLIVRTRRKEAKIIIERIFDLKKMNGKQSEQILKSELPKKAFSK